MIIWIASYPKSGNTWVRSLLSAYFFTEDGEFNFNLLENIKKFPSEDFISEKLRDPLEITKYWRPTQEEILKGKKIKFLKTHNCLMQLNNNKFTTTKHTLGVIYIIRDPRNVLTSFKNHMDLTYKDALKIMCKEDTVIFDELTKNYNASQFVGSWSKNYKTWLQNNPFKKHLVKYEDLEKNSFNTFKDLIAFINGLIGSKELINEQKLRNAIKSTNFDSLENKEKKGEFKENVFSRSNKKVKFFYLGSKNKWQNLLPEEIQKEANDLFENDLKFFNY